MMARHPWVAKADEGVRFGPQIGAIRNRPVLPHWQLYDDPMGILMEAGQLVERLGFDAVFLHDHPLHSPDPWIGLAALSTITERVMLGSVVNCVFYRHPAYLARMAADLDQVSKGRLMLGLGVGWHWGEFAAFEQPFDSPGKRLAALDEAVAIIEGSWSPEPFAYQGKYFKTTGMQIHPGPLQQPRPPLMIAGSGEQVTLRQVARLADACNLDESKLPNGPADIRRKLAVLRERCDEVGRPYDEILRTHFVGWLMLAPTEDEVARKVARYYPDGVPPQFKSFVTAGTPAQFVEFFQARAEAGIQYFVTQMLDGTDHETLHLLAEEVAPKVR
jgi:alkanesulfonate monooxygenase SsuD/methylene tetrahydromethanopterin reductase-like flavin-dependent oxidoreductase (luciferase family)